MKTLGILGGMGPQAGLRFCQHLLDLNRETGGLRSNADYPHFLLSNLPVPDLIADRTDEEAAIRMVEEEARRLRLAGANTIVLACNTMHLYADRIRTACDGAFLSMVDAVIDTVATDSVRKIGLLGSRTTVTSGLYTDPLRARGVEVIIPNLQEQEVLVGIIFRLIDGSAGSEDVLLLADIIHSLQASGAEAVLLGCTELPLILNDKNSPLPIYDSLRILADASHRMIDSWRLSP